MATKQHYHRVKLAKFSDFEFGLLEYLRDRTDRAAMHTIREAIRHYAQSIPAFNVQDFERWMNKEILPTVKDRELRTLFKAELKAFLDRFQRQLPAGKFDDRLSLEEDAMTFDSSEDF